MKENKYIRRIRSQVNQNTPYAEYEYLYFEYIDFLNSALADNPRNIEAICQLSIALFFARNPWKDSIELLEKALEDFGGDLIPDEKHMLLRNLA